MAHQTRQRRAALLVAALVATCAAPTDAALRRLAASSTPVRAVPMTEDTAAPGAGTSYPLCSLFIDTTTFADKLRDAEQECSLVASYKWDSIFLPTKAERLELCQCKELIKKLQTVKIPRCELVKGGSYVTYAWFARYSFQLCSVDGSSGSSADSPTTTPTTTAPVPGVPTPTPPTKTPTTKSPTSPSSSDSDKTESPSRGPTPNPADSASSPSGASPQATSSNNQIPNGSNSNNNTIIIGGIIAGVVIVALVALLFVRGRNKNDSSYTNANPTQDNDITALPLSPLDNAGAIAFKSPKTQTKSNTRSTNATKSSGASSSSSSSLSRQSNPNDALWDDPAIVTVRIPTEAITVGPLLSRGGYGEVYLGTFQNQPVAIKQLLPDRRKDMKQINAFLAEAKLLSTLDHERIVRFIGVAWVALSDTCVVVEYMAGGDLRSALNRWEYDPREKRAHGFDVDKIKIALHIAHALTYLHSCQPMIVHRDLKSKNILLDDHYDAKLTDFGVSRERADYTMTAGVGSSLWMAPEVMMGERYDEKADVFSFGVVLAELDTHAMPYSHALDGRTGGKLPESAVLQMVSLGRLTVEFSADVGASSRLSQNSVVGPVGGDVDEKLARLGRACVALDPKQRPTTGEVLHRVHQAWRALC